MHTNITLRIKCIKLAPKILAFPKHHSLAPIIHNIIYKLDVNRVVGHKSTILDHSFKFILYQIRISEAWIPRSLASFKYKAFFQSLEIITACTSLFSSQLMNLYIWPDCEFI